MELLALLRNSAAASFREGPGSCKIGRFEIPTFQMKPQYPPVGSKWKEVDLRVTRIVRVVRHDLSNGRVRINCIETERLTWAKLERFNGKSGGYAPVP